MSILGKPYVKTVQPFTKDDLKQIPFQEIIRNFQILEADNIPENPLLYLYPNTPKEEAFGKFYSEKSGGKSTTFVWRFFFLSTCILLENKTAKKHNLLNICFMAHLHWMACWFLVVMGKCIYSA